MGEEIINGEEGDQIEAEAEGEAEIQGEEFQIILVQIVERKDTGEEHAPIHHVAIFVGDQDICPMTVKRTQPTWLEYLWWMMKGGIEIERVTMESSYTWRPFVSDTGEGGLFTRWGSNSAYGGGVGKSARRKESQSKS